LRIALPLKKVTALSIAWVAAAAPELTVFGELRQHAHVDPLGMLRQHVPAALGDPGDAPLGPFKQQGLRHVGNRPGDTVGIAEVRPLGSGTCRSSSVTPITCATVSRTSAEVCGRPSACSASTGRIMDWKSGTAICILLLTANSEVVADLPSAEAFGE
jgi:hypothetical protein